MTMCKRALENMLVSEFKYSDSEARQLVTENWKGGMNEAHGGTTPIISPIGDVLLLFKLLRKFNIKVTSMSLSSFCRRIALKLTFLGLEKFILSVLLLTFLSKNHLFFRFLKNCPYDFDQT